ncbi:Sugar kinase of the NBD/HSP70 family, may contain an N-terminal HTH domain [Cohnella sp. OV330]|uniref:ROK family transcriptional regulator n=1 Tax=Cohnella sp. OV330 TaxID=1855288 RepID=UPI0008E2D90D|nr:ROK family protein [Cohnella sp. OV330]SFB56589.1 Sugar kinase of the NBD/HSP70 family, may contain an N-terminal HTH domain [Cohnella sp. OV330]
MKERIATPKDRSRLIYSGIRAALLTHGSMTKVELSRMLGISFPTISKFLSDMESEGELVTAGLDESSGGRRAQRYAYNPDHMLGLALFLEKNETHYSIFNCLGEAKEQGSTSSLLEGDAEKLAAYIAEILARQPRIRAVAVGIPGSVNNGRIIFIPCYEAYHDFDLQGYLETRFRIPVVIENDMNAAVLGFNEKKSEHVNPSIVYLYFGQNGPGAGILVNGDIVRGSTFFAGEVSFLPQYEDRNFTQALDRAHASPPGRMNERELDAVSRMVASCTAILNPHTIVFCRDEVSETLLDRIAERSAAYVPPAHLPRLTASDWRQDYLDGLRSLGLHRMISGASIQE